MEPPISQSTESSANFTLVPTAPAGFRSGFVALVGRPNVGKSTLLNALVGQKLAITSPIAQTTRNRLQGIVTLPHAQMILVDTPGIHKPHHRLGEVLVQTARAAMQAVDVVVLVVDGTVVAGKGDRFIANLVAPNTPAVVCCNKQDLIAGKCEQLEASYRELLPQASLASVSALKKQSLPSLLDAISALLPVGPYYYPPDAVTDQPERFIIGELIREQILHHTRDEVPHAVAIAVERVEETLQLTRIGATITVERASQKGIIIGKKGAMLKTIGSAARRHIQKLIAGKVYLELFVRVRPRWRQSKTLLEEFGYRVESE
ncbi:MAG: GTPase Era [Cyanobacteria bacterium P01_D01_bin.123]